MGMGKRTVFAGMLFSFFVLLSVGVFADDVKSMKVPDVTEMVGADGALFKSANAENFIPERSVNHVLFRWISDKKDEARYPAYKNSPDLNLFGKKVEEAIFRFKDNTLNSIYLSIYNRGDAGSMSQDKFSAVVTDLETKLNELTKCKPVVKQNKLTAKAIVNVKTWYQEPVVYILKSNSTGRGKDFIGEFITVEIEPFSKENDPNRAATALDKKTAITKVSLATNVKKDGDNVIIENIPMVDQGQKGYCVPAVIERVLRYYGSDVTQHTIAQVASTSEIGTSDTQLIAGLKKIDNKLGFRIKSQFVLIENKSDFDKFLARYNKEAKKTKSPKLEPVVRGNTIYLDDTLRSMNYEMLKTAMLSAKDDYKDFLKCVKDNTAKGIPMVWTVRLGFYKENDLPQPYGGHMRLIIGFNDKEKNIYFSDTWGAGHECKSMPYDDAWAITNGLFLIEPR